jgi:hypothetical protein
VKNSTTILLPQWYKTLASSRLPLRMMPRDVSTRWNSTYDMLHFALDFRMAIDAMTAMRDLDLRKYELCPAEWGIAKELRDVLKVSFRFPQSFLLLTCLLEDLQGCDALLFSRNPKHRHSHSSNGPH